MRATDWNTLTLDGTTTPLVTDDWSNLGLEAWCTLPLDDVSFWFVGENGTSLVPTGAYGVRFSYRGALTLATVPSGSYSSNTTTASFSYAGRGAVGCSAGGSYQFAAVYSLNGTGTLDLFPVASYALHTARYAYIGGDGVALLPVGSYSFYAARYRYAGASTIDLTGGSLASNAAHFAYIGGDGVALLPVGSYSFYAARYRYAGASTIDLTGGSLASNAAHFAYIGGDGVALLPVGSYGPYRLNYKYGGAVVVDCSPHSVTNYAAFYFYSGSGLVKLYLPFPLEFAGDVLVCSPFGGSINTYSDLAGTIEVEDSF